MDTIPEVNTANFEAEVLKSGKPVLVKFFATWCGPCKMLAPTLGKVAAEKADSVKTVEVDVDKSPELVAKYGIKAWPTLVIFRDGEAISHKVGGDTKASILKWIDDSLALPAGAKLDAAPKAVKLSNQNKQTLRDAFEEALNASPAADTPIRTPDGLQTTFREAIHKDLGNGSLFKQAEAVLTAGGVTLDQLVTQIKNTKFGPKS